MALGAIITLVFLHGRMLTGVAVFMTIRDRLEVADLILPLYHEGHTVPFAAAELYRRGYAKQVGVLSTKPSRLEALGIIAPPHRVWRSVLKTEGVPEGSIITIGSHIGNNQQLAEAVTAFLKTHGKSRIIVVASAPFSRLTRYDLRRWLGGFSADIRIYPVALREFDEKNWWKHRHGWVTYFDAYFLLALRLLRD